MANRTVVLTPEQELIIISALQEAFNEVDNDDDAQEIADVALEVFGKELDT